jgi:hypothetical protein
MDIPGGGVQRMTAGVMVQPHAGFRTKSRLESDTLATDELQTAASSADLALEVNKSSGDGVSRLQQGLLRSQARCTLLPRRLAAGGRRLPRP